MILITGATGKNGTEILKRLSGRKERIRAMVRRRDGITAATPTFELQYVEADFDDPASLRRALEGVQRAYLVTNSSDRVEEQQLRFVSLARECGVKHIVYLSQLHASPQSPLRFLRYHAAVEDAIRASGMSYTNLRPNQYMQGLLMIGKSIATEGRFFAPAGDARVSVVDVGDVAAVAVAALTHTSCEGKTYDLTGPEALTHAEMAAQLSRALDRTITYVDMPERQFREALRSFHMPDWQADGLIEDFAHYRRGEAAGITDSIRQVTGAAPHTFFEFARDHRAAFLGEGGVQTAAQSPVAVSHR
ncbi:MAG: SDR family oxidoreductase [Acidobacteriaceae bacterium]